MTSMMNGHRVLVSPGKVGDPWDYQDPGLYQPSPVRRIPVTLAMREADARRQRDQAQRPSDWQLGEELRRRGLVRP